MTTQPYVLCVTLNPVLDTSYFVDEMRPVYRTEARRVTHVAGGKGNNVSRGLALLGETAHSLVTLGGMIGRNVAEVLESDAFSFTPVWVQGETRLQITAIDAKGVQRAFYAPTAEFKAEDAAAAGRAFDALLPDARAVCLCGSSPGPAADPLYNRFIRSARERGILTVLDSYGDALREGLAAQPHLVKVNASEAAGLLGRPLPDQAAQIDAVAELREAGAAIAVLTLGESGALLATNEGVFQARPPAVPALNPIGSGDAMTAGLVAGLLRGQQAVGAFRLGMAAAAANTLTWEACRFDPAEVERLLSQIEPQRV